MSVRLQCRLNEAEDLTRGNEKLNLVLAVGYGGRWDVAQAARVLARRCTSGALAPDAIDEALIQSELALRDLPDPDLFGHQPRVASPFG